MTSPSIMCRKHLLGEHVELHMFVGTMRKGKSLQGYVDNNLVEPLLMFERHEELAQEMIRRGYNHQSPLDEEEVFRLVCNYHPLIAEAVVNRAESKLELVRRCEDCKNRCLMMSNRDDPHPYDVGRD